jgi:proteic killer suppression protein
MKESEVIFKVVFQNNVEKQIRLHRFPDHIVKKVKNWIYEIEEFGLEVVRKKSGYHDEPLRGKRFGQRSVRLNKSYRVIYREIKKNQIEFILIEEVSKHEY